MPIYQWKGIGSSGKKRKGKLEATDEQQVENFVKRLKISDYTIKIAPKDLVLIKPKVTQKDVMIFTRQFSTMIDAGLPLVQSLKVLTTQESNLTFKQVLKDVNNSVQSGGTLSDAFRKFPKIYDELYCNLVAAGEAAGILDSMLKRLATYIEKAERLKRKVKGAMLYPAIVMFVAITVIVVLLVFVIPVFEDVFSSFGSDLPPLTQAVMNISDALVDNYLAIVGGLGISSFLFLKGIKTVAGKKIFDRVLLKLPAFGDLLRKVAVAKFGRTLGTMLQAGVPIISSLDIVANISGNTVIEEAIIESRIAIGEGRSLTDPFLESGVFPAMVISMIAVGEEAGSLDTMLYKIADFYDEEVDAAVDVLTTLIEPALIIFLGITVGTVVIAMYMPIFTMGEAMG